MFAFYRIISVKQEPASIFRISEHFPNPDYQHVQGKQGTHMNKQNERENSPFSELIDINTL